MKKGILGTIDWLDNPVETQEQRKSFCDKVVSAKPTIEKLVKRMLGEVGREYFGELRNEVDQSYVNGAIDFANSLLSQLVMFEGEQQERNKPEEKEESKVIHSGSELGL